MHIWKYELEITDKQTISFGNSYAKPLSVAEQNGKLMMWVSLLDDFYDADIENVVDVRIIGTGMVTSIPISDFFLGSVLMSNGFVWHVYVQTKEQMVVKLSEFF